MRLYLSKDISLPSEAITQTFGILGKRGSGKTTTASVFAEELLKARLPLVIIDPTGAWWGLRSSKDGQKDGFSITILGGDHGDVPLEETAGKVIADLVAEEAPPLVLDLSILSKNAMRRFMIDFAEELHKKNRNALSVILDEADMFAPQRIPKGGERLFGAIDEIVRRGRIRGLGVVMISQRSAAINKDILSQCEVLIAHRANHPRDLEPVLEWMRVHATKEQIEEVHRTIAQLADGEAWVMSPEWLDFFGRVQVRDRETFNSSATPRAGELRATPKHLTPVDLAALQKRMAATIERAKENDPEVLKRRIRELERRPAVKEPEIDKDAIARAEERGFREAIAKLSPQIKAVDETARRQQSIIVQAIDILSSNKGVPKIEMPQKGMDDKSMGIPFEARRVSPLPRPDFKHLALRDQKSVIPSQNMHENMHPGQVKLRAGARRMLAALVQWYPNWMTEGQMLSHAGLKGRKSGTASAYKTDLRQVAFAEQNGDLWKATQAGIDWLGHDIPAPSTTEEVLAIWLPKLRAGARRMLEIIVKYKGEWITDEQLQDEADLHVGGTYSAYKTDLRTARLIVTENGMVAANKDTLFL